jgi:acetolactate synthase-1/2/3 large subunit
MHQERDYPERLSATDLRNPDFAALARAYGGWAATVERTEEFGLALKEALSRTGIRLLHCRTDVEVISHASTISRLREQSRSR